MSKPLNINGISWLLPCLLASLAGPVSADVYKWVDANGHVQYGDRPPVQVKSKKMAIREPSPAPAQPASVVVPPPPPPKPAAPDVKPPAAPPTLPDDNAPAPPPPPETSASTPAA